MLSGLIGLGAGCATSELMPTPNLHGHRADNPFAAVPLLLRTNTVDVLYATDRAPEGEPAQHAPGTFPGASAGTHEEDARYGFRRSRSLAFGLTTVRIGGDMPWDELVAVSRSLKRKNRIGMRTVATREAGRLPPVPTREVERGGQWEEAPESVETRLAAEAALRALVARRLALTPRKEVYVFVHGTGSDFESPAHMMAGLWHFMGRCGVPAIYSWPSGGSGDSMLGYDYDRESSEFTIFHLKQFLRLLAACPGVQKVHLIAHSRGCDTALSAVRELNIEIRASGGDVRQALKLGGFVLAAADMDLEVSSQRVSAERLMRVPEQMALYVSSSDLRLRLASFFFGSQERLGQAQAGAPAPRRDELLIHLPEIQFIDASVAGSGRGSHFYLYDHPAVVSDLILLLRDNRRPGAEHGRPLAVEGSGLWRIDENYPGPAPGANP